MTTRDRKLNVKADLDATQRWLRQCDDQALLKRLLALLADDSRAEAELLSFIAEVDQRKLYRQRGFSSMFQYAVDELHLSEGRAYKRITAARAARTYPTLLERIARGELHLSAISLLARHLTPANHEELASLATHKSKRAIERMLAERFPQPDAASRVRKLPPQAPRSTGPAQSSSGCEPKRSCATTAPASPKRRDLGGNGDSSAADSLGSTGGAESTAAAALAVPQDARAPQPKLSPGMVEPRSAERYKVTFTAEQGLVDKLKRAQELLGPSQNNRDLAAVFDRALDLLVRELENKKHGVTSRPRKTTQSGRDEEARRPEVRRSRSIPRAVRRAVYERDQGQCAYCSADGRRCSERSGLEYHHRLPFARGGEHSVANIELRCRAHNALAAEEDFGAVFMASRAGTRVREPRAPYQVMSRDHGLGISIAQAAPGTVRSDEIRAAQIFAGIRSRARAPSAQGAVGVGVEDPAFKSSRPHEARDRARVFDAGGPGCWRSCTPQAPVLAPKL